MQIFVGDEAFSLLPVAIAVLIALLILQWRRKYSLSYLLCFLVFGIYLLFAIEQIFFPIRVIDIPEMSLADRYRFSINLIPFRFDLSELPNIVLMQIFLNILLTVPFGFGINFLVRIRVRRILWIALAVGFSIELIQFVIGLLLGYPYHIIDINDMLLNTLGVLIGYGIFRVFARCYLWLPRRFTIKLGGLPAYIYNVASHKG